MRILFLSALLMGCVMADDTVDGVEGRATKASKTIDLSQLTNGLDLNNINIQKPDLTGLTNLNIQDPLSQLLLAIGNVVGIFDNIPGVGDLLTQLSAAGIDGVPATILATIVALSAGKATFLALFLKPLQIANQVLAIIGIALLGTYLVESEGDFTGLIRRSDDTNEYYDVYANYDHDQIDNSYYTNRIDGARSLTNTPIVQRLGKFVSQAIDTYEKLNSDKKQEEVKE